MKSLYVPAYERRGMIGGLLRADYCKQHFGALRIFVCFDEEIDSRAQPLEVAQDMSKGLTGTPTVDF